MGLQDVFFKMGLPFDSPPPRNSASDQRTHLLHALWASTELAEASGPHEPSTRLVQRTGELQFDLWDEVRTAVTDRRARLGHAARAASSSMGCATA